MKDYTTEQLKAELNNACDETECNENFGNN